MRVSSRATSLRCFGRPSGLPANGSSEGAAVAHHAWETLAEYTSAHHGVISLDAARQIEVGPAHLDTFVRSGRLRRVAPEVYAIAGQPRMWQQHVAIAAASTAGWASHRTAAALWQLDGFDQAAGGPIEVLTPKGRRVERRGRWVVHETRRFRAVDLDEVDGIPCTTVARTILDLPAVAHLTTVGQALDSACRRWPGILTTIVQRFVEVGGRGRPGSRLLRVMLEERVGAGRFAQSGFERQTLRLVRAAGLPEPVLQCRVDDIDFVAYLDLGWPAIRWAIECDSLAFHSGKRAHETDRARRRRLKQLGWDLVEVTYDDVVRRPDDTGRQLRDLHVRRTREVRQLSLISRKGPADQRQNAGVKR